MNYELFSSLFLWEFQEKRKLHERRHFVRFDRVGALRWFLVKLAIRFVAKNDGNTET